MLDDVSLWAPGDAGYDLRVPAWRLKGVGSGPAVHLQAGIHADEIAGMLVLHRLLPRLQQAASEGRLLGSVTVVPQANPYGLAQFRQGRILGRFHEATHSNFNRGFVESARQAHPARNLAVWQKRLLELAADATIVLDLHTDDEALPYLYLHDRSWPAGQDLAACLRADVVVLWDGDSDGAFEEAVIDAWQSQGVVEDRLTATIELRGQADVSEALAEQDADGLYRFLCLRGVVDEPVPVAEWRGLTVPIGHMETVFAPSAGVLVFDCALGDRVEAGQVIAHIITRPGDPASELKLRSPQGGILVTRYRDRLVPQGAVVAKLTGTAVSSTWAGGVLDP